MKAMVLERVVSLDQTRAPLTLKTVPDPTPGPGEVLIKVQTCGVCHTELDEIEGRTPPPVFPMVLGHQVVGKVADQGPGATRFQVGDCVGAGWIFSACGTCPSCLQGLENLCEHFKATGRDAFGGYAEFMVISQDFAARIPKAFSPAEAAPLLCAGAIGYRSLRLTQIQNGQNLGLTGFGASAHLVLKMVEHQYPDTHVFVFARNEKEQAFARDLGAVWAGGTEDRPPERLHSVIDTTPAWKPVVAALQHLIPGGRLVINAIRKESQDREELLRLDYPRDLWMEKEIKSVANVARRDIQEFLDLAARIPIRPEVQEFPLEEANQALWELKHRNVRGAKVLRLA